MYKNMSIFCVIVVDSVFVVVVCDRQIWFAITVFNGKQWTSKECEYEPNQKY